MGIVAMRAGTIASTVIAAIGKNDATTTDTAIATWLSGKAAVGLHAVAAATAMPTGLAIAMSTDIWDAVAIRHHLGIGPRVYVTMKLAYFTKHRPDSLMATRTCASTHTIVGGGGSALAGDIGIVGGASTAATTAIGRATKASI